MPKLNTLTNYKKRKAEKTKKNLFNGIKWKNIRDPLSFDYIDKNPAKKYEPIKCKKCGDIFLFKKNDYVIECEKCKSKSCIGCLNSCPGIFSKFCNNMFCNCEECYYTIEEKFIESNIYSRNISKNKNSFEVFDDSKFKYGCFSIIRKNEENIVFEKFEYKEENNKYFAEENKNIEKEYKKRLYENFYSEENSEYYVENMSMEDFNCFVLENFLCENTNYSYNEKKRKVCFSCFKKFIAATNAIDYADERIIKIIREDGFRFISTLFEYILKKRENYEDIVQKFENNLLK